jgi:hypothetical protein
MKKSNRITRKSDSAPISAQAKRPAENPDKKPVDGLASPDALAESEPVKKLLSRLCARHFETEGVPADAKKKASPALVNELRRFLSESSFAALSEIESDFGVTIEAQLAAALGTWLKFLEHKRAQNWDKTESHLRTVIQDDACVLDPNHVDYLVWAGRAKTVSQKAARFYVLAVRHQLERPFNEARPMLEGLRDLIEGHGGFADQAKALSEMLFNYESAAGGLMIERAELPDTR